MMMGRERKRLFTYYMRKKKKKIVREEGKYIDVYNIGVILSIHRVKIY